MIPFSLGLLSILSGTAAVYCLFLHHPVYALGAHLVAGFGGLMAARATRPVRVPCGGYEMAWAMLMPCVGGVFAWLHPLAAAYAASDDVADEYAHYLNAEERLGDQRMSSLESESYRPDPDHLEAMADILRSEAPISDKRLAIEALAQMETPLAVQLLRGALTSTSTEVRFYAASILANLEERLAKRLAALEGDVTQGRRNDAEVELQLARCYFDFAYYGLAEGNRCEDYLQQALVHIRRYHLRAITPAGLIQEGRILLSLGQPSEAEKRFSRAAEIAEDMQSVYLWRAEARFAQGDYSGVRLDIQLASSCADIPERLQAAAAVWN